VCLTVYDLMCDINGMRGESLTPSSICAVFNKSELNRIAISYF